MSKFTRLVTGLLLLTVTVWMAAFGVSATEQSAGQKAVEAQRMPELDPAQRNSLKVTLSFTDTEQGAETIMQDVTVKAVKVADLQVNGGFAEYTLTDPYRASGIELAGMTASESVQAAAELTALVSGNGVFTAVTEADGSALFSDLESGMYLIFQDAGANEAYEVDPIAAMLIAVPYPVVSAAGNTWQYAVEAEPKTELTGAPRKGQIRVTKQLYDMTSGMNYYPPEGAELIFYVGLFTDEACTVRAVGTADLPLRFVNSSSAEAVFENLPMDQTYYIAETDGNGAVITSILKGEVLFAPVYPEGQSVALTRENPEAEILFQNTTPDLPSGYYYSGVLSITKKTVKDGRAYPVEDVFYAGVFADPQYKEMLGTVLELKLDRAAEVTVPVEVHIGESENDSVTYYVTETDREGNPLKNGGGQTFTFTLSNDGKATLSAAKQEEEIVITNDFTEKEEESESEYSEESEEEEEVPSVPMRPGQPRTGDETPIVLYAGLMAAAFAVIVLILLIRRKRRR